MPTKDLPRRNRAGECLHGLMCRAIIEGGSRTGIAIIHHLSGQTLDGVEMVYSVVVTF